MLKQLVVGLAALIAISIAIFTLVYAMVTHAVIVLGTVLVLGMLLVAYAIGDILLFEYYRWK